MLLPAADQPYFYIFLPPIWLRPFVWQVRDGKMHNFLRMYWAKKILEWSPSPQDALSRWGARGTAVLSVVMT